MKVGSNLAIDSETDSDGLDWRGFGEIWTAETYHLHLRPSFTLAIDPLGIEARCKKKQIRFSAGAIVEARSFKFPVPSMTLVFHHEGSHALVSLFCISKKSRDQFTDLTGVEITDQRTWRTGFEAGRDQRQYCLQGSG